MSAGPGLGEGTVTAFDEAVGLGTVTAADGTAYPFHCTQIADGSRSIEVGTPVAFVVRAGLPGRWEAFALRRCARPVNAAPAPTAGPAAPTAGPAAPAP